MSLNYRISELPKARFPFKEDNYIMAYDSEQNRYVKSYLSSIYEDVYKRFIKEQNINSMAFEMSSDYALCTHSHDCYNNTQYASIYEGNTILCIPVKQYFNLSSYNETWEIKMGNSVYSNSSADDILKIVQPKLGSVKFVTFKYKDINISSSSFDGWVYADGKSYNASLFKMGDELLKYFPSDSGNSGYFTIPHISSFFSIYNYVDARNCISSVPYKNSVGIHTHETEISDFTFTTNSFIVASVDKDVYVNSTENGGDSSSNAVQHSNGKSNITQTQTYNYDDILVSNLKTVEFEEDGETHPTYNAIPMMVYIGRSSYSEI